MAIRKSQVDVDFSVILPNSLTADETIESQWKNFPGKSKDFILRTLDDLCLTKLVTFWAKPPYKQYTRGSLAGSLCVTSWYLALIYLSKGRLMEARALILNGAFLQQCYSKPIEDIIEICGPNFSNRFGEDILPYYTGGYFSVGSPEKMQSYLEKKLPMENQRMMAARASTNKSSCANVYIDQVSADWNASGSVPSSRKPSGGDDDKKIKICFADELDANKPDDANERLSLDVGISTPIKNLFHDYANKRGVSLRALRFSYAGETLFLSSVRHKTPKELGMSNEDVIHVGVISPITTTITSTTTNTMSKINADYTATNAPTSNNNNSNSKKSRSGSSKKSNNKGKNKRRSNCSKNNATKSMQDYKLLHSQMLTLLFEEAEPKFKEIRQSLNALGLERSQPKSKLRKSNTKKETQYNVFNPSMQGLGGKAGKSHFLIHVGDAENLYKTTKQMQRHKGPAYSPYSTPMAASLDLHGCTKKEALEKLNQNLEEWHDAALRGSYPWVMPVEIVCGCGNQVLSETVEQWIKDTNKVSNAPRKSAMGC